MFKHCIQDSEQFAYARGESHLFGFPRLAKTLLVECSDDEVVVYDHQYTHVENRSNHCQFSGQRQLNTPQGPHNDKQQSRLVQSRNYLADASVVIIKSLLLYGEIRSHVRFSLGYIYSNINLFLHGVLHTYGHSLHHTGLSGPDTYSGLLELWTDTHRSLSVFQYPEVFSLSCQPARCYYETPKIKNTRGMLCQDVPIASMH